eukprot:TRINITY_DN851_c0_g1_i1.p1 TRINITY_DN851_c0_g1~~TRINITY_DN851_c0_g1_i1.p1  ORF type:complete len:264 (+),score=37.64 TRINITY_DN851_c0_g1_i1:111-902(+)
MAAVVDLQTAAYSAQQDYQRLLSVADRCNELHVRRDSNSVVEQELVKRAKQNMQRYHEEERALKNAKGQVGEQGNEEQRRIMKEILMGKEVFKAEMEEMVDQLRNAAKTSLDQVRDVHQESIQQANQQQQLPQEITEKLDQTQAFILGERERLNQLKESVIQQVKQALPYTDVVQNVSQLLVQNIHQQHDLFQQEIEDKRQHAFATHDRVAHKVQNQHQIRSEGLQDIQQRLAQVADTLDDIKRGISSVAGSMNIRVYQSSNL